MADLQKETSLVTFASKKNTCIYIATEGKHKNIELCLLETASGQYSDNFR
jgi:hypothetical protein